MAEYETTRRGDTVVVRKSNTGWLIAILLVVALVVAAFAFGLINVDQTKTAALPDVKVETSGGSLPKFDVNTAKVDVGTKTEAVAVPTVKVDTKQTAVEVPTVSVTKADGAPGTN